MNEKPTRPGTKRPRENTAMNQEGGQGLRRNNLNIKTLQNNYRQLPYTEEPEAESESDAKSA